MEVESVQPAEKTNFLNHKGHEFIPTIYHFPANCEACAKPLWHVFKPPAALECRRCHVKCHRDHLDKKEELIAPCKGISTAYEKAALRSLCRGAFDITNVAQLWEHEGFCPGTGPLLGSWAILSVTWYLAVLGTMQRPHHQAVLRPLKSGSLATSTGGKVSSPCSCEMEYLGYVLWKSVVRYPRSFLA